ncbi:MAG: phosphatase PAP2 family protein [Candidatus Thiodiazotropha sp.]
MWAFWVGIAFFSVYPTCNWLTAQRNETYQLYLKSELDIPLVQEFFWVYMSMYGLFLLPPFVLNTEQLKRLGKQLVAVTILSGILFLLIPTQLGFVRVEPQDLFYQGLFGQLFAIDLPHNLVPSLHVVFSAAIALALLEGINRSHIKLVLWIWLVLLCLSTLLVHQHHLLDVFSGLLIAVMSYFYFLPRKTMFERLIALFVLSMLPLSITAQEADHQIHEELRSLLQGMEQAVNEQRYHDLAPYFHKNLRVTTINQENISSRDEIGAYFDRWFGPDGYLKKVEMTLTADAQTELYADKTIGIVRGSGQENYVLSDSRYYEMLTRWTATVIRDDDGKWRILSLHIGTNFLDNPILDEAENSLMYFAIGGFVIGIVVMLIFNILRRPKKQG